MLLGILLAGLIAYWADQEYGNEDMSATLCSWAMCLALVASSTPAAWHMSSKMTAGSGVALILVLGFAKVSSMKKGKQDA